MEGYIDTEMLEPEGPFGESHGHVALEDFNMSMTVTAITYKKNAVFSTILSEVTPSESSILKKSAYEALYFAHLKNQLEIRGIKKVVMHEPLTNIRPVIFLQMERGTPTTEVWRALYGVSSYSSNCGKFCIALNEDIDPTNTDAVFWSMAYRSTPSEDVQIINYRRGVQGSQYHTGGPGESTLLIDATQKYPMPPLALPGKEYMEHARALWEKLKLPTLSPKGPWHGYTLGDWNETWERFAKRTVVGDWEASGLETIKRRREDLSPETPTANHEKL